MRQARAARASLEATFDAPALLVLPEGIELEGPTVTVAASLPSRPPPTSFDAPGTLVVPVRRKLSKSTAPISFGRSSICDVVLPFTTVSKHHGDLEERQGAWHITDLGSTNGTEVDGRSVGPGGAALHDRSVIRWGHLYAQFLSARALCGFLRDRL